MGYATRGFITFFAVLNGKLARFGDGFCFFFGKLS